ncbi:hypothetical protein B5X24_HaOG205580, partial [Helicoverpa armigera]
MAVMCIKVFLVVLVLVGVCYCQENATNATAAPTPTTASASATVTTSLSPVSSATLSAVQNFNAMVVSIPLGIVQALKYGAKTMDSVVRAFFAHK